MTSISGVPRVGVGVFILNARNEFVFGKRKGSHGAGTWALPGGHLELHESFEDCAQREILEETGLEIEGVKFLTATNSLRIDGSKHYITIFVVARLKSPDAEPKLLEPQKCEGWHWISWDTMLEWYQQTRTGHQREDDGVTMDNELFLPMIDLVEQRPGLRPLLED